MSGGGIAFIKPARARYWTQQRLSAIMGDEEIGKGEDSAYRFRARATFRPAVLSWTWFCEGDRFAGHLRFGAALSEGSMA